jgi:subtilisin-like proprotein convertase family protein
MPAINYNFVIEQGSEFNLQFQYNDIANNPVDLSSGYCVVLQMVPASLPISSGIIFSSKTGAVYSVDGWELTANNQGLINFKLGSTYTQNLNFNNAVYDLDILPINDSTNKNLRLSFGNVTIQKRQTVYPISGLSNEFSDNFFNTTGSSSDNYDLLPIPPNGDLCSPIDCLNLDIYSTIYPGSGLSISDASLISGIINTTDTRLIENVELIISNLNHTNPQDLQLLLAPPSGDKILLCANQKINNYTNNFNFMFSNKAPALSYLHNINNGGMCSIYDKTNIVKYSSENLLSSFSHLFGHSLTGNWTLIARDTDPIGSGYIDGWKLIITYVPE